MRTPSDLRDELSTGGAGRPSGRRPSLPVPASRRAPHREWPERFGRGPADRAALVVLLGLASLTPRRLFDLAIEHGTAEGCLSMVRDGGAGSDADVARARVTEPAEAMATVAAAGARMVPVNDPEYPPQLIDLFDPPAALFVKGQSLAELEPRVAVVGARNCSGTGGEVAELLGRVLAGTGVCVVSGAARGVDGAAHRGALHARGTTIAVLGCGIDIAYPIENGPLLSAAVDAGAVVSEYPPKVPPEPFRFPARNRIVAGLSVAVVIVEGAHGSGSMITAEHALDVGREVFAVPGPVTSELSHVPHSLIREGATLIRGPDDLLSDLGLAPPEPGSGPSGDTVGATGMTRGPGGGGVNQGAVWEALSISGAPDRLAALTALPLPQVMAALVGLELRGLVRAAGGRYQRRPAAGWS
jgi:DNA processing protein